MSTILKFSPINLIETGDRSKIHSLNVDLMTTGLEVIKLESILRLKIRRNDWLLADT